MGLVRPILKLFPPCRLLSVPASLPLSLFLSLCLCLSLMWDAETPLCPLALTALLGMWVSPGGDGVDLRRTSGRRTVTQLGRKVGGKRASDLGQLVCSAGVDSVSAVPWREREWHLGSHRPGLLSPISISLSCDLRPQFLGRRVRMKENPKERKK